MKTRPLTIAIVVLSLSGPLWGAPDHAERKLKIEQLEQSAPSVEARERKDRSIAFLKSKGVRTIDSLPVIQDSNSAGLRTPVQIAERVLACTICAVGGETGDRALMDQLLADFSAAGLLSPNEKEFLKTGIGDQRTRVQFSWQYERSWVLLWALGYVETLDYPTGICDVPALVGVLRGKTAGQLVREAKPRTAKEILDAADLIYRLHWAVVEARVNKNAVMPEGIQPGVVQERHAALNWLIGYMKQDWDDVSTDT